MYNSESLREERARLARRMNEILERPGAEGGVLTSEQEREFDRLHERQGAESWLSSPLRV